MARATAIGFKLRRTHWGFSRLHLPLASLPLTNALLERRCMPWDPAQYLKFADHRLRPAIDLLNRVDLESPGVVYDLGAGTGNVTELLAERLPDARVIGVDSSPEMLDRAERVPNLEWQQGDIGAWRPELPPDLIFSNAALHWVDGHGELFSGLMGSLAPSDLSR